MRRFISELFDEAFWRSFGHASVLTAWHVLKIVVLYVLVRAGLRRLINRVIVPILVKTGESDASHAARLRTLAGLVNSICSYVLAFVVAVMLLQAFGLNPVPLLTTASVAGVAVAFGAQKLVKDVISGFFIVLENQYAVGEYVTIGAVTGTVEEVGMRTTRIRDDAGKLYMMSNGDVSQVCNQSRGAVSSFIEIGLAPGSDMAQARTIIDKAGADIVADRVDLAFTDPPAVQGLGAVDGTKITLRVVCATVNPAHLIQAQIALRGLVHERLVEAGFALA